MTHRQFTLEQIQVAKPCPKSWDDMAGDAQRRFCTHCQKHVHNLSAMTRSEAEKLVCASGASMCAIYEQTSTGKVVTLDYAPPPSRWGWRRFAPVVALASLAAGMLSFVGYKRFTAPRLIILGEIAPARMPVQPPAQNP